MKEKRIDWEERHFQICLALLSRTDLDRFGHQQPPKLTSTIAWADKMIILLKQRAEGLSVNEGKIRSKVEFV